MTDSQTPRRRELVSPLGAVMLRAMLTKPRDAYYCAGLAETISHPPASLRHVLTRLERAGWISSTVEPRVQYQPRRLYKFTPDGLKAARAEIKTWNFIDE